MRQAARAYAETQITTTSQGQVLIMLYDGAIKFLTMAKERIAAKDYAGKGKLISSTIDIINELASSLNAEKGGDLAANLNQLYFYCNKRLFLANSRMDISAIDEVIKILGGIRSAYAQIMDTPEAIEAMAQAAASAAPKAPRAPMGVQAGPAPGTPIPKAKVHNAYATQSAAVAPGPAQSGQPQVEAPLAGQDEQRAAPEPAIPAAPERPAVPQPELPVAEVAAAEEPKPASPAMPDLDLGMAATPPPSLTQAKRLAGSSLYRKFAS